MYLVSSVLSSQFSVLSSQFLIVNRTFAGPRYGAKCDLYQNIFVFLNRSISKFNLHAIVRSKNRATSSEGSCSDQETVITEH